MDKSSSHDRDPQPRRSLFQKMLAAVRAVNEILTAWITFATKAIILSGGILALLFVLSEITGSRGLVFTDLDVPSSFETNGYTGKLLSRQIAQRILVSSGELPRKLTFMFASDRVGEDRRRLEQNITRRYDSEHQDINVAISLGFIELPFEAIIESLRKITGAESKRVVGVLAQQNDTLIYNIGYLHSKTGARYETFYEALNRSEPIASDGNPEQSHAAQRAINNLVNKGARFILKQNNPLIYVLEDYRAEVAYSSSRNTWCKPKNEQKGCYLSKSERVAVLQSVVEHPPSTNAAQVAHALLGDIYEGDRQYDKAVAQYEKAIELDSRFANLVGIRLANRYLYQADITNQNIAKGRKLLLGMLKLDPLGRLAFVRLLNFNSRALELIVDNNDANRAQALRALVREYEAMLTLADSPKEQVSVYKGMLMALAEEARITQNHDSMFNHLRQAVAAGLIIHEHELAFLPYAGISKDPRFIEIRKQSERTREIQRQTAESVLQFDRLLGSETALGETRQLVVVVNEERRDIRASMHAFEKIDNRWIPVFIDLDASVGRNGFSEPYRKMEGDGMAPAGIYDLGRVEGAFGYDSIDKIATRLQYRQVTDQDFWIDDSASPDYNRWVKLEDGATPQRWDEQAQRRVDSSHERLRRDDHLYKYGIVVDYNVEPEKSYSPHLAKVGGKPKGSAIFLHWERAPGAPTAGCIATSSENMLDLFKWLDPAKHPKIAMGTREDFSAMTLVQ